MENCFLGCEKGSTIDLKLGKNTCAPHKSEEKKKKQAEFSEQSTSNTLFFRVSGVAIRDKQGKITKNLKKKEAFLQFKEADIPVVLREVLQSNGLETFNQKVKDEFVKFLEELLQFYEKVNTRAFLNSSVLLIVDNISKNFKIKWIDFNYPMKQEVKGVDNNVLPGIQKLLEIAKGLK